MVSTTLYSQGAILENGSGCGNGGQNIYSEDRRGSGKALIAWIQLAGQSEVTYSQ